MKIACKNLDRLVNVGIRPNGMPREDINELYEMCAKDEPVSYKIASDILKNKGCHIGIITGAAVIGKFDKGESDGPLGSAALAKALVELGYEVTLYTEIDCFEGLSGICALIGCNAPIVILEKTAGNQAVQIANELDIAICIEKVGVNAKGVQHSVTGMNRNGMRAFVDPIINKMNDMGKITVGIGDGGNEIGFGNVYEAARNLLKNGKTCVCGCDDGIVTVTKVKHMYPVAISNWGAYAIVAALAIAVKNPELAVKPEDERKMLMKAIELELVDGGSGKAIYALDGVGGDVSVACVTIMKEIVDVTLTTTDRGF